MIGFYATIAMWTWFYPGQPEQEVLLACRTTVAEAVAHLNGGEGVEETVSHIVTGLF